MSEKKYKKYVKSICLNCGGESNHDELDEDICPHCKIRNGNYKHITIDSDTPFDKN